MKVVRIEDIAVKMKASVVTCFQLNLAIWIQKKVRILYES